MDKKKEYNTPEEENRENRVGEPAAEYQRLDMFQRRIPDYVLEDIQISLEQYERGEYEDAGTFIKSLYR